MSARNSTDAPLVSHGRGGAANIGADPTPYVDGEIVREGPAGDQGDGAFSTGRGGAANIGSPGVKATTAADHEVVPEMNIKKVGPEDTYHVGRGGEGNFHKGTSSNHEGLADKLKHKLFGKKKEEEVK